MKQEEKKAIERREKMIEAAAPLMKFINEEFHPHAMIVVTTDRVEVFEGAMVYCTDQYIND